MDEYIDDGWSGTNFDRPGVQRLLEDAKNGRINVIIVKDLSRFGRNYIEVGRYTDYLFPTFNVRFIALGDNVDSAKQTGGMDMTPIMNVFNEWHAATTSKKIRTVIEANAKAGKYRSGQAPYGYVKGTDDKKLPVIDEPAASNVRRIFEMRAKGISPNKIAQTLNDEKIPTSSDYKEQKFGIPNIRHSHHLWSCGTVKQILNNPSTSAILYRCVQPIFRTRTRKSSNAIPRIWYGSTILTKPSCRRNYGINAGRWKPRPVRERKTERDLSIHCRAL